ncbi:MAG TPA: DUF3883 domain-containing protein [Anaerovoracaceae bacterium]|nr:DUF3883 domain-containing protein [Anaerovoracaceae bacterium]
MYSVPEELYFRIHHVRPRFKGDIENVLIYVATEISKLPSLPKDEFAGNINRSIMCFPGNSIRTEKTINNWRTEISALFGYMITVEDNTRPGKRAMELAEKQDLVESFKIFLYSFQYPGAHVKPNYVQELIEAGIRFKPAQYILKLLQYAEESTGNRIGITKAEVCHCIFNDLRCTRDNEDVTLTWERIKANRDNRVAYNQNGDVIRYAGDILDYMEIANLLITYSGGVYYLNSLENEAIIKFVNSEEWYTGYDSLITSRHATLSEINKCIVGWFEYVNRDISETDFETDILAYIADSKAEYEELKKTSYDLFGEKLESVDTLSTKDIGDIGESLVHGHECQRVKIGAREDLIHLIKRIPTQFAVGYDILSVELDSRKRCIEVKTTISARPIHFNKFHLTTNEWNAAESYNDRYFVYRLMISKYERKLFVLQDPVKLYKTDLIQMVPRDGADITFDTAKPGEFKELLSWEKLESHRYSAVAEEQISD